MTDTLRFYDIIQLPNGSTAEKSCNPAMAYGHNKIARAVTQHGTFNFIPAPYASKHSSASSEIWHLTGETKHNGKPATLWRRNDTWEYKMEFAGPIRTVDPKVYKLLDAVEEMVTDDIGWMGRIDNAISDIRQDLRDHLEERDTITVLLGAPAWT